MNYPRYSLSLQTVTSGFDSKTCWVHPAAGIIPGDPPRAVLVMQKLLLSGSDVFSDFSSLESLDSGSTWSDIRTQAGMQRRREGAEIEVVASDIRPGWHQASGTLVGTGATVRYRDDTGPMPEPRPREGRVRPVAFPRHRRR